MTEVGGWGGCGPWGGTVGVKGGQTIGGAFEGAADDIAGAETHSQRQRENDAAEEDAEGELDDGAADAEVIEDHGTGKGEDEPLDAEREKAGVLQLGVDAADQHGTRKETGKDGSGGEQKEGADGVGDVGQKEDRHLRAVGIGRIEGGDADDEAEQDASPEDHTRDEERGAVGGREVGDAGGTVAVQALVEVDLDEDAAEGEREKGADAGHDEHGDEQREDAGKETRQFDERPVHGRAQGVTDLVPERWLRKGDGIVDVGRNLWHGVSPSEVGAKRKSLRASV